MNNFTMTPGRVQRLIVAGMLLLLFYIAYIARDALFPFVLGAVVAYVVSPLVERIAVIQPWYARKPETARGLSVLAVYVIVLGVLTVAMLFFVPRIIDEVQQLIEDIPEIFDEAQARVDGWTERYQREVPEKTREQINEAVQDLSTQMTALAESLGRRSLDIVFSTVTSLLGFISVPFFVFYALKDRDRAFGRFYQFFGEGIRPDVRECVRIANRVIGAYVRAQLFLGLVIFLVTLVGLQLMGIDFAIGLAFIAGVTELIPIIGPLIGFVPAFIVVLATEPDKWWWVILFYLGVQAAENYLLVPRIHSSSVNVHPAIILILLAVGGALWGLWGVLIIVPLFAAGRDVYSYIHRRLGEEETRRREMLMPGNQSVALRPAAHIPSAPVPVRGSGAGAGADGLAPLASDADANPDEAAATSESPAAPVVDATPAPATVTEEPGAALASAQVREDLDPGGEPASQPGAAGRSDAASRRASLGEPPNTPPGESTRSIPPEA